MGEEKIDLKEILPDEVHLEAEIAELLKTKIYAQLLLYSVWKLQNNQSSIKTKEVAGKFHISSNLARYYLDVMTNLQFFFKRKIGKEQYYIITESVKKYQEEAKKTLDLLKI